MSNYISSLQAKILQILLEQTEPVTAAALALRLDAKPSTVRYHLVYIQNLVGKFGGELIARPKIGYLLKISAGNAKELRDKLRSPDFQFHYDDVDRLKIMLFEMLASTAPLTLSGLAETLGTSKSTLIQDLDAAENWLQKHRLQLNRQTRKGTQVLGEEADLRQALVYLILETLPENDLLNLCRWGMLRQYSGGNGSEQAQNYLFSHIASWDLSGAWWVVNRMLEKLSHRPSDKRYLFLVLYWAVMTQRIQQNLTLTLSHSILRAIRESPEYQEELAAIQELNQSYGLQIPTAELAHFSVEIQTSAHASYEQLTEVVAETQDEKAAQLAEYLMAQVKDQTGFSMTDPVIFRRMCHHLGRTLTRIKYNLPSDSAFASEVTQNHPQIWNAVFHALQTYNPETARFSQEETTYLAMYFILAQELECKAAPKRIRRVIVACPAGGISIWMLVSRLQKEFPDVEIVAAISLRDLPQQDKSLADLIITTAHHVADKDLPVITVSPFLNEQEVLQLKAKLES